MIEYLDEIETKIENTFACLSGAQMGTNHEKNWRSKISRHTPSDNVPLVEHTVYELYEWSLEEGFQTCINITLKCF